MAAWKSALSGDGWRQSTLPAAQGDKVLSQLYPEGYLGKVKE